MENNVDAKLSAKRIAKLDSMCETGFNKISVKLVGKTRQEIREGKDFKFTIRQVLSLIPKGTSKEIVIGRGDLNETNDKIYSYAVNIGVLILNLPNYESHFPNWKNTITLSQNVYSVCEEMWREEDVKNSIS